MTFEELRDKAHSLPLRPGVYIMQDAQSKVIYVGKAKALRSRVSQYFQDQSRHNAKTRAMVAQIDHFDVIEVASEFEALVLECALIKRHQPHYNILLKDDKGYPYIRLTVREDYPRFSLAAKAAEDAARYFGPYGSRGASQDIIDALRQALKLPSCSRRFPRDLGKERPCLNYHMGLCDGYCRAEMDQSRYREAIDQAVALLEGKLDQTLDALTAEMEQCAEELAFERAAQLRDRIGALRLLAQRQKAVAGSLADTDAVGFYLGEAKSCFVVLHYLEGELAAKDWQLLTLPLEAAAPEAVSALVTQYYSGRRMLPRQILLPCPVEGMEELARMLTEAAGRKVELLVPQKGQKAELVAMANENAAGEAQRAATAEERTARLTALLGSMLGLDTPPRRIEAFDISNTGNADIVASMTVHQDGKPLKRDWRRFILKDMPHADDYASMEQVVERRLRRFADGDEHFQPLPDLMLIDGGAGQVKAALAAMDAVGIHVPAWGMVKDDRHRTRALQAADGREAGIQQVPALFAMIGRIQEETHNYAIEFHRQRQAGHLKGSALDAIPGVGPKRKAELLRAFKSVRAVRAASLAELEQAVPKGTARTVYDYFHQEKEESPCGSSPEQPGENV